MDPVRAIRTWATYPAAAGITDITDITDIRLPAFRPPNLRRSGRFRWLEGNKSQVRGFVTGQCYPAVSACVVAQAKYSDVMTTSMHFPGPRDGLDEGSLAELAQDCREVEVDVAQPRAWAPSTFGPIEVTDDASALIDGLAAYGS